MSTLERVAIEGDSPIIEINNKLAVSRVGRDTCYLD